MWWEICMKQKLCEVGTSVYDYHYFTIENYLEGSSYVSAANRKYNIMFIRKKYEKGIAFG